MVETAQNKAGDREGVTVLEDRQTHHLQSQEPWRAEAVHAWHPPGHASLTKGPSSSPSAVL